MTLTKLEICLIIGVIVLILALVGGAVWHHDIVLTAQAQLKMRDEQAVAEQAVAVERAKAAQKAESDKAVADYESEISGLHAAVLAAGQPVIRLCNRPADPRPVPSSPGAAAGTKEGAPAARNGNGMPDGVAAGPDVGSQLRSIAEVADRLAAQERATQEWAR